MLNSVGFSFRFSKTIKLRRDIQAFFNKLCEKHGFEEIEAPIVVPLTELVGIPPSPLQLSDLNRSFHGTLYHENSVVLGALRYESTASIANLISKMDFKEKDHYAFHYFQEMVRLEKTEDICAKRQKSFFQLGIEYFSLSHEKHLLYTAHIFKIILDLLFYLNLNPKIRLSHIDIVKENLKKHNFEPVLKRRIVNLMEKNDFFKLRNVLTNLNLSQTATNNIIEMARLKDVAFSEGITYVHKLGLEKAYLELKTLQSHLKKVGVDEKYVFFDTGIHRSLNFYSGIIFQLDSGSLKEIAGGGDFSILLNKLNAKRSIFAMGLALGYERLLLAQTQEKKYANQSG